MARHFAKVVLATDDTGADATLIIDCDQCGRHEYQFAIEHIATLARVLTDVATREGLMVGATEKLIEEVASSHNPADAPDIKAKLDAGFDAFKRSRTGGEN